MSDAAPVSGSAGIVVIPVPSTPALTGGNGLPQPDNRAASAAAATPSAPLRAIAQSQNANAVTQRAATAPSSLPAVLQQLNKYLNDSGRANRFRIDPESRNQTIQEINPSNGEVVGEYSVAEFPALARSLGVSGVLFDSHA